MKLLNELSPRVFLRKNHDEIDPTVISSMIAGDSMAFNRVFARYYDKIYRFTRSLIRVEADVEDLVQELFRNLWEKRDKIDPTKNFNGFLYRMARNLILDHLKANSIRQSYENDYTVNFAEHSEYINSEDLVMAKEVELVIRIAISQMPEQRRRIFELREYEGLSNEEIADRLMIQKATVANQLSLGRKDIKDILFFLVAILATPL